MATFAAGLRTPFARYRRSGFLADFGDGVRLAAAVLAWRHRRGGTEGVMTT